MKKKTKIIFNLFLLFFLLFLSSDVTKAVGSASTGFSGNSSVYVGDQIDVILYVGSVNGTNGGLAAFGGNISYSTDKLELVRASSLAPFTVELSGNRLGGFGQNTIKSSTNIIKFIILNLSITRLYINNIYIINTKNITKRLIITNF